MDEAELFSRGEIERATGARPDRSLVLTRDRRGVYSGQPPRDEDDRYRRHVRAADRTLRSGQIFSHESAAVMLGLPRLGTWPDKVHLIDERRSGGRSQLDVVRHCLGLEDVQPWTVAGLLVTSPARTAFDIAATRPFVYGVMVADAALRMDPQVREELPALLNRWGTRRGHRKAAAVIAFADARSETAGESFSRVEIDRLGFVKPELQVPVTVDGVTDWGDFGWEEVGGVGEFDGEVKYRLDRYRKGGAVEDVVIREKNRENRMRRRRPRFARWDYRDLRGGRLERILIDAGIPKRFGSATTAWSRGTSTRAQ